MPSYIMGDGELAVHNCYVKHRKKKATVYIGKLAGGTFVLKEVRMFLDEAETLRAEVERLDSECSELYAALASVLMWTDAIQNSRAAWEAREHAVKMMVNHEKHGRLSAENEVLRAMCDELAEALDQELCFHGDPSDFDPDRAFNALARYRSMTATGKDGE